MTKLASIDEGTVRKAYARWEPVYDLVFGELLAPGRRQAIDVINRREGRVLEVGVGTGISLPHYRRHLKITGIDLSPEMLSLAERTAGERGLAVRFAPGDAVDPEVDPQSVDVVTNRHLLWTLREPETAMANWLRILRPGGTVLSVDGFWFAHEAPADPESPNVFDQYYSPATRAALPFMGLDDTGPIVETFERAGYSDVRAEYLPALTNTLAGATPYFIVAHR